MGLIMTVGLFCGDVAALDAAERKEIAHTQSVCMASTMGFGPALTKAGLQIDASVSSCSGPDKLACVVNVLDVVESCAWVAAYITAAAGECTDSEDRHCAAGITALVASIVAASQASSAVAYHCPKHDQAGEEGLNIGSCVVDSWEAAWALAKAGILIDAATIDCGNGLETKCELNALMV